MAGLKGGSSKSSGEYTINSGLRRAERDDKKRPQIDSSKRTAPSMLLETLNEWRNKKQKIRNLMRILGDPYFLVKSYEDIKSNPGNMTKGTTHVTLDKISFD
jgi:hypothetical protein